MWTRIQKSKMLPENWNCDIYSTLKVQTAFQKYTFSRYPNIYLSASKAFNAADLI